MAGRKLAGYRPECPRKEHKHSNVLRYGYHGHNGHQRPRWKCIPANGDKPHEFSETLPRQTTHSGFCEECERGYAHHEGPQSASEYSFSIREVAAGLIRVGQGAAYREAAIYSRERAQRFPVMKDGRIRRTNHGQLIGDWIEVFAPVVYEPHRVWSWPEEGSVLLDELPFRINNGIQRGRPAFTILAAMGWDKDAEEMCLWKLEAVPTEPAKSQPDWEHFLRSLPGEPKRIVCDQGKQITRAVSSVLPNSHIHYCEYHLKHRCYEHLKTAGITAAGTPLYDLVDHAFGSVKGWEALKAEWAGSKYKQLQSYVRRLDSLVMRQLEHRSSWPSAANPVSTGALENHLDWLRNHLSWRSGLFTNRERTNRALLLMMLNRNELANEAAYAASIRDWLLSNHGRPRGIRREVTDPRRHPSLRP